MLGSLGGHCDRFINAITGIPESEETPNTSAKLEKELGALGNFIHFHSPNPLSVLQGGGAGSYLFTEEKKQESEKN